MNCQENEKFLWTAVLGGSLQEPYQVLTEKIREKFHHDSERGWRRITTIVQQAQSLRLKKVYPSGKIDLARV